MNPIDFEGKRSRSLANVRVLGNATLSIALVYFKKRKKITILNGAQ